VDKAGKLIPKYLEALTRELEVIGELAYKFNLDLHTIYIGGGTPTALFTEELETLLRAVAEYFPVSQIREYTVEAGRPDSITQEKLKALKFFGVSRISVNPQTMNDAILKEIGREHTAADTEAAFHVARDMGFDNINMDIIAGLPGESPESFKDTLQRVLSLNPDSITVHTLTVKRSSALRTRKSAFSQELCDLKELLLLSQNMLKESGFWPYYLYRQQATPGNHENAGYSQKGKEGVYNIVSMEETETILAAGAGGVTKLCGPNGKIKRVFNYKYPYEYIRGFEEILARKQAIRDFYHGLKG
jgi:oxygen-independent coproporphyrinogen-3 oxidase